MRHLILFHGRINVKLKRMVTRLVASILVFAFSSTTAFAGLNLGNDDGTNFKGGTSNNYWGVYTDGGVPLNDTEGLRVTIYDAKTNVKVFNTIDITGNANISAASAMQYFSDGNELISKTTWLNYVSSTYNSVSETDMAKFNSTVMSRASSGGGYKSQYIPELASVDIVSVNNTSNLDAIKSILGDKNFLGVEYSAKNAELNKHGVGAVDLLQCINGHLNLSEDYKLDEVLAHETLISVNAVSILKREADRLQRISDNATAKCAKRISDNIRTACVNTEAAEQFMKSLADEYGIDRCCAVLILFPISCPPRAELHGQAFQAVQSYRKQQICCHICRQTNC